MKHHTTKAGLLALLVALLLGPQAWSQTKEDFQDLRRDLKDLKEDVDRLRNKLEDTAQTNRTLISRLDEMTRELKRLNDGSTVRSTSGFGRETVRSTGTLRFANSRYSSATVIIDGIAYTVEPRSTRVLRDQPAGSFRYEVLTDGGDLPARTTRLYSNETLTVNIFDRLDR